MYARILRNADHIRRFTIHQTEAAGWEVREERDSRVVRTARYRDWHRVERAQMVFAREAALLQDAGWTDG
jgi:hypothetical protein